MKTLVSLDLANDDRNRDGYEDLLAQIRHNFDRRTSDSLEPLFKTDAGDLYELFLRHIPAEARQHYNCNACRHFVNRFGGLVTIDEKGHTTPVMWDRLAAPLFFIEAVEAVAATVKAAKVTGVFITSERRLGTPITGEWHHMAVDMMRERIHRGRLRTAWQVAAKKAEDYQMLGRALGNYDLNTVQQAVHILRAGDTLYRGEKVLGVAEWFMGVHEAVQGKRGQQRNNVLWRAAATAPVGFCHISSTMIGTLLDDLAAGMNLDTVRRRFAEKMNPLQYQRPKAAPTAGNVARAEEIVAKLGLADSLRRRFARVEELQNLWTSSAGQAKSAGVFAGIKTKRARPDALVLPRQTMTWEKFGRTVLPLAEKIELYIDPGRPADYSAIVTAVDPAAPPIVRWDREDNRNPFSWYLYVGKSTPATWNLSPGWANVTAVTLQPSMWQPGYDYQGKSVFFILENCRDLRYRDGGLALFPEILKSELHEVRATIEAYSKLRQLEGVDGASACGLRLQAGHSWNNARLRVTTATGMAEYNLDRWD